MLNLSKTLKVSRTTLSNWSTKVTNIFKKKDALPETEKKKVTIISRLIEYLKVVKNDYKNVAIDIKADVKRKPMKATLVFLGLGGLYGTLATSPDKESFKTKYLQCINDIGLVSANLVNPVSETHLQHIQRCYNHGLIRHTNLGLFAIIWVDNYSDECKIYETNCTYLKLPYRKIPSRVIDVGFWNIWWVISRKMLDYDINY